MNNPNYPKGAKAGKKNIFISYRVRDTAGETGRLVDSLKQYFYEDQIFMDIDKLEPGVDFTEVISKSLENCDVMLAVIGPDWIGVKGTGKEPRIKEPHDWVRIELATALSRNIRVVPVLVDDAELPSEDDLPEDLQPLLKRQSYELSNKRWRYDTENLVAFLEKSVGIPTKVVKPVVPQPQKSAGWVNSLKYGLIGVGALFIILVAIELLKGDNSETTNLKKDQEQGQVLDPVSNDVTDDRPINDDDNQPPATSVDIDGVWDDQNGMFYLDIFQDGTQTEVYSYSKLTGQKTGEGTGNLNGRNFSFQINVINVGLMTFQTKVSPGENRLQGTLNIENNGAKYSEPLVLLRRKE